MVSRNSIWLPIIASGLAPAQAFYETLRTHPLQQHPSLGWEECLGLAAGKRSTQASQEWGHSFLGDYANRIVRRSCFLPPEYGENTNSVESLVAGIQDPVQALAALLVSPKHADHLLGRNAFFKIQTRCGIGFSQVVGSQYQFYYCILLSK